MEYVVIIALLHGMITCLMPMYHMVNGMRFKHEGKCINGQAASVFGLLFLLHATSFTYMVLQL